jgi:NMD protein affecting ribosome stability and mRNA decay
MASIRRCRRCGELFVPGLIGINLVIVRIRRCSVCGKLTPLYVWGDAPAEREEAKVGEEKIIDEEELLRRRIEESKYAKP